MVNWFLLKTKCEMCDFQLVELRLSLNSQFPIISPSYTYHKKYRNKYEKLFSIQFILHAQQQSIGESIENLIKFHDVWKLINFCVSFTYLAFYCFPSPRRCRCRRIILPLSSWYPLTSSAQQWSIACQTGTWRVVVLWKPRQTLLMRFQWDRISNRW